MCVCVCVCVFLYCFYNVEYILMTSIISFHLCVCVCVCVCVGGQYKGHVDILAPTVQELATLEREAQTSFLHLEYLPNQLFKAF